MALSDQLTDLAQRTKKLEDAVTAAHEANKAKLEERRQELKASQEARSKALAAKVADAKAETRSWWLDTTAKFEQRRAELEAKHEQHMNERSVEAAERVAEQDEDNASMMIAMAAFLIDSATKAVVEAGIARERASELKKEHLTVA